MDSRAVIDIARQELVINIRNRWTIIFAAVFGILVVSISYFGMMAEGFSGMQSFTRTSASIVNLVLYIVPLVALLMGTLSFTGDKGSTELLYSQPVSRSEVVLGKLLGLFWSIAVSTLVGFSLAGVLVTATNGVEGLGRYVVLVLLSLGLSLVFLSISVVVATANKRKSKAFGMSLLLWFFFVILYDLLALGATLFFKGHTANVVLFLSLFGNPVDMVRVASLISLDNVTILGAAGAAMLRFLGGATISILLLVAGLSMWIVLPLFWSHRLLRRQDI
ncbi:MAG TPA: ABC transporter permease [Bacteroidetes bacterium]|nr:ABC transporter permease [Bacteroidota bacterium]